MIRGSVKLDLKNIGYVRGSLQNKATRIAINKASVPVKAAVVAAAPKDVGNLRQSVRIRSRYYAKSKVWAAIVGPSSSFSRVRKKPKKVKPPKKKKPNKTLQALKRKADALRKKAGKKLGKAAGKFASRVVKAVGGKKGRKLLKAVREHRKANPKPKTPKPSKVKPKKVQRRRRKWNGKKVRPARYAHFTQWGSAKISGRHWLDRALSRSRGQFASILTSALKTEIAALMNR
jgi:hypothetical protein